MGIIEKIFGTHSEHELKRIYPIVDHIDALEPEMQKLSDEELKEKTKEFKERLLFGMLRYFVQLMPQGASFLLVLHQTVGGTLIACVLCALVYLPMRRISRRFSRDDRWFFR